MKKLLLSIFTAFFIVNYTHAQSENHKIASFGIKGGLSLSNVHSQKNTPLPFEKDSETKLGFHLGLFSEIFVNEDRKIAIQPELFYSQDGYKISNFTKDNKLGELNYTLQTYNLPILFKYYFTKNFNIFVGPQLNYQASQKYEFDGIEISVNEFGYQRRINSTNIAVVSGLEISSIQGFSINARYLHGAHTLYKTRDNVDITHRGFQIGIGYKF